MGGPEFKFVGGADSEGAYCAFEERRVAVVARAVARSRATRLRTL